MTISTRATLFGILAIFMWGSFTGLIRSVSESFGVNLGAALIYTTAALILMITQGFPNIRRFPPLYLYLGGALFVLYEVLLALSVGLANSHAQSIEISLINYLWPSLVVLFSLWINQIRFSWLLIPGLLLAFSGIIWSLSGDQGIDIPQFIDNIRSNPLPYGLVSIAAVAWGIYCNIAKRFGAGENGVSLFFSLVAITLWIKFFISADSMPPFTLLPSLEFIIAGIIIGSSYSFWEMGIQKGNMPLLATLSYFTPILSILFSGFWLDAMPSLSFWYGVLMVSLGSFLCYLATRH